MECFDAGRGGTGTHGNTEYLTSASKVIQNFSTVLSTPAPQRWEKIGILPEKAPNISEKLL